METGESATMICPAVGGIVLCGGRSTRMGRSKAWLPFGNEFLLQRVVRILSSVVEPIVVVAAPDQEVPPLPAEVLIVRDSVEGLGPLNALATGLAALQGKVEAAYFSACDVPYLKPEFVRRVVELLGDRAIGVPRVDGYLHPLAAVYRVEVLPKVLDLLNLGHRRLGLLLDEVPTRTIEAWELADVDAAFDSLRNVNAPDEYERASRSIP